MPCSISPVLLFLLLLIQFPSKSRPWTLTPQPSRITIARGVRHYSSSRRRIARRRSLESIHRYDKFSTITKLLASANNENTSNKNQSPLSARTATATTITAVTATTTAAATSTIAKIPRLSSLLLSNRTDNNNDDDKEAHEDVERYSIQRREYDALTNDNDEEQVSLLVVAAATIVITAVLAVGFASSSFSQGSGGIGGDFLSSSLISTSVPADFVNNFIGSAQDVFRDPGKALDDVVKKVDSMGSVGIVYFGIAYCVAEILAIPAIPLTASAGYLFGPVTGTAVVLFSASIAAAISFQIGRTLLRDYVEGVLVDYPKFAKLDKAIGREGFRLMLLLRLSPIFPFALSNYLYGASSINFTSFFGGTVLGFAPGTIAYVYTGYVGKALTTDGAAADTVYPWYVYITGLSLFAALLKVVADTATRVVEEIEAEEEAAEAEAEDIITKRSKTDSSFF